MDSVEFGEANAPDPPTCAKCGEVCTGPVHQEPQPDDNVEAKAESVKNEAVKEEKEETAGGVQGEEEMEEEEVEPEVTHVRCAVCRSHFHLACENRSSWFLYHISKYHCRGCETQSGPSIRRPVVAERRINLYDIREKDMSLEVSSAWFNQNYIYLEKHMHLNLPNPCFGVWVCADGAEFARAFDHHSKGDMGWCDVFKILSREGLGIRMPDDFDLDKLIQTVGADRAVDVVDVVRHTPMSMRLAELREEFDKPPDQRVLLNMLSLEFSDTDLARSIEPPSFIGDIDLVKRVWPDANGMDVDSFAENAEGVTRPEVLKFCLVSMGGSYTDWHVDFGGSSVWYHVYKGEKVFLVARPTAHNLREFERYAPPGREKNVLLANSLHGVVKVVIKEGETVVMPSGWIHCVFTPVDSLVFGGNFIHEAAMHMQCKIYMQEERLRFSFKYRFPEFELICRYVFTWYTEALHGALEDESTVPLVTCLGVEELLPLLRVWADDSEHWWSSLFTHSMHNQLQSLYAKYKRMMSDGVGEAKYEGEGKGELVDQKKRKRSSHTNQLHMSHAVTMKRPHSGQMALEARAVPNQQRPEHMSASLSQLQAQVRRQPVQPPHYMMAQPRSSVVKQEQSIRGERAHVMSLLKNAQAEMKQGQTQSRYVASQPRRVANSPRQSPQDAQMAGLPPCLQRAIRVMRSSFVSQTQLRESATTLLRTLNGTDRVLEPYFDQLRQMIEEDRSLRDRLNAVANGTPELQQQVALIAQHLARLKAAEWSRAAAAAAATDMPALAPSVADPSMVTARVEPAALPDVSSLPAADPSTLHSAQDAMAAGPSTAVSHTRQGTVTSEQQQSVKVASQVAPWMHQCGDEQWRKMVVWAAQVRSRGAAASFPERLVALTISAQQHVKMERDLEVEKEQLNNIGSLGDYMPASIELFQLVMQSTKQGPSKTEQVASRALTREEIVHQLEAVRRKEKELLEQLSALDAKEAEEAAASKNSYQVIVDEINQRLKQKADEEAADETRQTAARPPPEEEHPQLVGGGSAAQSSNDQQQREKDLHVNQMNMIRRAVDAIGCEEGEGDREWKETGVDQMDTVPPPETTQQAEVIVKQEESMEQASLDDDDVAKTASRRHQLRSEPPPVLSDELVKEREQEKRRKAGMEKVEAGQAKLNEEEETSNDVVSMMIETIVKKEEEEAGQMSMPSSSPTINDVEDFILEMPSSPRDEKKEEEMSAPSKSRTRVSLKRTAKEQTVDGGNEKEEKADEKRQRKRSASGVGGFSQSIDAPCSSSVGRQPADSALDVEDEEEEESLLHSSHRSDDSRNQASERRRSGSDEKREEERDGKMETEPEPDAVQKKKRRRVPEKGAPEKKTRTSPLKKTGNLPHSKSKAEKKKKSSSPRKPTASEKASGSKKEKKTPERSSQQDVKVKKPSGRPRKAAAAGETGSKGKQKVKGDVKSRSHKAATAGATSSQQRGDEPVKKSRRCSAPGEASGCKDKKKKNADACQSTADATASFQQSDKATSAKKKPRRHRKSATHEGGESQEAAKKLDYQRKRKSASASQ